MVSCHSARSALRALQHKVLYFEKQICASGIHQQLVVKGVAGLRMLHACRLNFAALSCPAQKQWCSLHFEVYTTTRGVSVAAASIARHDTIRTPTCMCFAPSSQACSGTTERARPSPTPRATALSCGRSRSAPFEVPTCTRSVNYFEWRPRMIVHPYHARLQRR
jgi:hypothetical protein